MDKSIKNDEFRKNMRSTPRVKGQVVITSGVQGLDIEKIAQEIRAFDTFNEDNDPYKEHDFGQVIVDGNKIFWKIDYYEDERCEYGFDFEGAEADIAYRVLTIMLADEY